LPEVFAEPNPPDAAEVWIHKTDPCDPKSVPAAATRI